MRSGRHNLKKRLNGVAAFIVPVHVHDSVCIYKYMCVYALKIKITCIVGDNMS